MSETIAGYRILSELGRGAEGVVYLAESPGLRKTVALKVFDPAQEARFKRALETYRALERVREESGSLTHLAEGIAAGPLPEGGGFLATAYQASGSMADRVRQEGPLPAETAAALTQEVLRGLSALHAAGLCHRDVKPHNVLLDASGHAVLGDFGLVSERESTISTGGTPAFAAPEQWSVDHSGQAEPPPRRSGIAIDVYGAGATCYYLLTGRSPVPGAPDLFLLESRNVPRPLQSVLLRALAPRAEDRHPSAEAFIADLETALRPPSPKTSRDLRGVVAGGLVLTLAAGALLASSRRLDPSQGSPGVASRGEGSSPLSRPSAASTSPLAERSRPSASEEPTPSRPTSDTRPPATPSPSATPAPPAGAVQPQINAERTEISLGQGPERVVLARYAGPPLLVAELSDGRFACCGVAELGAPPVLDLVSRAGERAARVELESFPERILSLPGGRAALATSEGAVLLWDPKGSDSPRELTRFAHAVLDLEVRQDKLWVRGDLRRARPLAEGEGPGAQETLIEGVLGRYAFPLTPELEERVFDLD